MFTETITNKLFFVFLGRQQQLALVQMGAKIGFVVLKLKIAGNAY